MIQEIFFFFLPFLFFFKSDSMNLSHKMQVFEIFKKFSGFVFLASLMRKLTHHDMVS